MAMTVILVLVCLNNLSVIAQESSESSVIAEFLEKQEAGLEVYALTDEEGNFIGYYEPYSESNPVPEKQIMPLYSAEIEWTIDAGRYSYGTNIYTIQDGMVMQIDISQSISGKSYLTFQNRNTNTSLRFTQTETTDGWHGTVTFAGMVTTIYSFGIENASNSTITYSGTYSL